MIQGKRLACNGPKCVMIARHGVASLSLRNCCILIFMGIRKFLYQ